MVLNLGHEPQSVVLQEAMSHHENLSRLDVNGPIRTIGQD